MKLIFKSGQRRGTNIKTNFHPFFFCFNLNLAQLYTTYQLTMMSEDIKSRAVIQIIGCQIRTQPVKNKMKKQLNLFFSVILLHVILKVQSVLSVKTSAAWRSCSCDLMGRWRTRVSRENREVWQIIVTVKQFSTLNYGSFKWRRGTFWFTDWSFMTPAAAAVKIFASACFCFEGEWQRDHRMDHTEVTY